MKSIASLHELKSFISTSEHGFLLLYKDGNPSSDCAFSNVNEAAELAGIKIVYADVNSVRDIHTHYHVSSVPTLLEFSKGVLKNIVKGCQDKTFYSTIFNHIALSSNTVRMKRAKQVIVYTTPTCTYCSAIKNYLSGHGILYREIDVSRDEHAAQEMVRRSGQQGVPQTVIDGRLVVGYNTQKLNELLEIQ